MSEPRDLQLSPDQLDLKLATREAVGLAGGQSDLAHRIDLAQSRISDGCSKNTRHFLSVEQAARIEDRIVGVPPITRAMARRQGYALFRLPDPDRAETVWSRHCAEIAKEANEVVTAVCDDLADDNEVDPVRARRTIVEVDEAIDALVRLRGALDARAADAPAARLRVAKE
jgi:hypothetical protein